jgi:acyl carrier protein
MTNDSIYERLGRVFREHLHQPTLQIVPRMTQDDIPGWDSTAMASIIVAIEEEFGFEFSSDELRSVRSVGDLAHIVAQHPE